MAPKLYYIDESAPARAVLMTAAAIGLEFEKQIVDLFKKEHLSPDYIKVSVTFNHQYLCNAFQKIYCKCFVFLVKSATYCANLGRRKLRFVG